MLLPAGTSSAFCDLLALLCCKTSSPSESALSGTFATCGLSLKINCISLVVGHSGGIDLGKELVKHPICSFYGVGHAESLARTLMNAIESYEPATHKYHTTKTLAQHRS